jgi:acetyl esterase/lipase
MKINIKYGKEQFQYGELYIPYTNCIGTVCLLHGGFWTMPYSLDQFDGVAVELLKLGYCVWNIEYRRIGGIDYKWRDTFDDSINAVNELVNINSIYNQVNLSNVFVIGHSAGGHLAIWLNSQDLKINISKFIGLSPILDLENAFYKNSGNGSVEKLLHGKPDKFPERYLYSSPIKLCRKNSPELIIHGKMDEYIPIEWSELYYERVRQLTDKIHLIELDNCRHMDFIDPKSDAFAVLKTNLIMIE